jgi:hypothetical protein
VLAWGAVTPDLDPWVDPWVKPCVEPWVRVWWEVVPWAVEPGAAEAVRVAIPMPNDAPRAPTMPSPARPAWSRLLRWCVAMSSTLPRDPVPDL